MNNKLKKFEYIKNLIIIIYFVFGMAFGANIASKLPEQFYELNFFAFLLGFVIFLTGFYIIFYIIFLSNIILHELGHLVFGLKAKLKFISFNILNYTIYTVNNKLKLKKEAKIPGVMGFCNMTAEENKKYSKNSVKLYYLGGIIFNSIFVIISIILMLFTNNEYLRLLYILNIGINSYLALNNSIPAINKSGTSTDTLQIIYYNEDEEYINTVSRLQTLQSLIAKGCELKDIDIKLFSMPKKIKTNSDVLNAMIYVDYLISKEQYDKAIDYANKILKEAEEILLKQNIFTLKLQLIICIFNSKDDLNKIKEIWDEELKKYLDLMGRVVPLYIAINYMYAILVEKNEENSNKYLSQFEQLNKKKYDKYQIEEVEKLINDINIKKEKLRL